MVLEDYARDMEGYENDKMERHDKTFIDPLAKNFNVPGSKQLWPTVLNLIRAKMKS